MPYNGIRAWSGLWPTFILQHVICIRIVFGIEMKIQISLDDQISDVEVLEIFRANQRPAAENPEELLEALRDSHSLVTARMSGMLVGLGNAISDGHMVVYYPYLVVHPQFQGRGIGRKIMETLQNEYSNFHRQVLIAEEPSVEFYRAVGFEPSEKFQAMWLERRDH